MLQGFLAESSSNLGILSQGINVLETLRSRVDPSTVNKFAGQLREIFQSDQPNPERSQAAPVPEDTSAKTSDSTDALRHDIRGVNPRSPFDFSALAEEFAQHEVIQLNNQNNPLNERVSTVLNSLPLMSIANNLMSGTGSGGILGGMLGAQARLAQQKLLNAAAPSFATEDDLPPKRGLQGLGHSIQTSLLSSVLGVPGRSGGLYGRFGANPDSPPAPSPLMASSSSLRKALREEQETLNASKLKLNEVAEHQHSESARGSNTGYQECIVPNSIVIGPEDLVVRSKDILTCQTLCQQNIRCKYCTFRFDEKLCYHYTDAERLEGSKIAISAPKVCPGMPQHGATERTASASDIRLSGLAPKPPVQEAENEEFDPFDYNTGGRKEEQLGGVLSGLLGGASAPSMINAATSMMATGSQFMGAIPFKELAQAGLTLAENGYLRNRGVTRGLGGRAKDKTLVPPPPGSGTPSVSCHGQGMTCCIPRTSMSDWQRHSPYLNHYKTVEACQSVYVTTQDALCVTSVYDADSDKDRCGVQITQTNDMTVYRNTLTVPNKSMNNAICECIHSIDEAALDPMAAPKTPLGSARWEYSLAATENARSKLDQTEESATRLVKGAQAAQVLSQIFSGGSGGGGSSSGVAAAPGVAAVGDMIGLASNLGSFMNNRRAGKRL